MKILCLLFAITWAAILEAQEDVRIELDQQIEALYYDGNLEQAIEVAKKIIEISPQKDTLYITALSNLAILYFSIGDDKQATQYTQQSLTETKEIVGQQSLQYANALGSAAYIYKEMGQYELAKENYIEALALYEKIGGKTHDDYTTVVVNLANVYVRLAEYKLGEQMYKEALEIDAKVFGKDHPNYTHTQSSLAYLYQETNRYEEAVALYKEIIATKRKTLGAQHIEYAISLNDLGTIYKQMEIFERAKDLFEQSLTIIKNTQGSAHSYYATILHNLASTYEELGDYELAKNMFEEVLSLDKLSVGVQHPYYAQTLGNLASLHVQTANYDLAEVNLLEALTIFKNVYGERHPDYVRYSAILGNCYLKQGQYQKTIAILAETLNPTGLVDNMSLESLELKVNELLKMNIAPDLGNFYALTYLITASLKLHKSTAKVNWLNIAFGLNQKVMDMVIVGKNDLLLEQGKLRMLKIGAESLERAMGMAETFASSQKWEATWQLLEQNKSVLLADALRAKEAKSFGNLPDSLVLKEQDFQQTILKLKDAIYNTNDQVYQEELEAELNRTNLAVAELTELVKKNYPKYYQLKYENKELKLKEIQDQLDHKTAIIEYFIGDTFKYAFVITAQELKVYPLNFAKAAYKKNIDQLRKGLTNYPWIMQNPEKAYVQYIDVAHELYKLLLKNPLAELKGIEHLVIMPDHWLNHIPFEVLLTEKANQILDYANLSYLLKDYTLSYSYSSTLWLENKKTTKNTKAKTNQLLALAANYEKGTDTLMQKYRATNVQKDRASLQPLPHVKHEIEQLEELFAGKFIKDKTGTEANFKQWLSQYGVIHLAMHGLLDKNYPILSALAFTEDGDTLEDNFLRAYEIAQLDINAALVVLSACETGYGKFERGEGAMSLARSFMYAGVPSLVVSLWKVNDMATAKLMKYFYQGLEEGQDKAKALQQAKLTYIKHAKGVAKHPAFWAAFVLQGDKEAISIATKGNNKILYVAIAMGLTFLGLGLWIYDARNRKKREIINY